VLYFIIIQSIYLLLVVSLLLLLIKLIVLDLVLLYYSHLLEVIITLDCPRERKGCATYG